MSRELVERWRALADDVFESGMHLSTEAIERAQTREDCADELEAALSAQGAVAAPVAWLAVRRFDGYRFLLDRDTNLERWRADHDLTPLVPMSAPTAEAEEAAHSCFALVGPGCVGCLNYKAGMEAGREHERALRQPQDAKAVACFVEQRTLDNMMRYGATMGTLSAEYGEPTTVSLYSTPQPQVTQVTEEMVERAANTLYSDGLHPFPVKFADEHAVVREHYLRAARAALTAAINGKGEK